MLVNLGAVGKGAERCREARICMVRMDEDAGCWTRLKVDELDW